MPPMEVDAAYHGCLPSCELHSSLAVACRAYSRMRILRLPAQSQDSENAQRNLEIAQISRLRGTYTQVQNNAGVEVSDYSAQCSQCSQETVMVILVCRSLHDQIRIQGIVRYKRNGRKLNNFKSGFR